MANIIDRLCEARGLLDADPIHQHVHERVAINLAIEEIKSLRYSLESIGLASLDGDYNACGEMAAEALKRSNSN